MFLALIWLSWRVYGDFAVLTSVTVLVRYVAGALSSAAVCHLASWCGWCFCKLSENNCFYDGAKPRRATLRLFSAHQEKWRNFYEVLTSVMCALQSSFSTWIIVSINTYCWYGPSVSQPPCNKKDVRVALDDACHSSFACNYVVIELDIFRHIGRLTCEQCRGWNITWLCSQSSQSSDWCGVDLIFSINRHAIHLCSKRRAISNALGYNAFPGELNSAQRTTWGNSSALRLIEEEFATTSPACVFSYHNSCWCQQTGKRRCHDVDILQHFIQMCASYVQNS